VRSFALALGIAALAATTARAEVSYEIYQVRPGDTAWNLAARFGVPLERIQRLDGLPTDSELQPGESVVVMLPERRPTEAEAAGPTAPAGVLALTPRFARVKEAAPITAEPGGGRVFFHVSLGSEVIVNAERGQHWGVVMVDGSTGWLAKGAAELTDRELSAEQLDVMLRGGRPDIVQAALRYLGTPYEYGGALPHTTDCSLLVQAVFASRGIRLPRTAAEQFEVGSPVHYTGLLPGDRLYFISPAGRVNHTGIYVGGGRFVHASARRGRVALDRLDEPLYWSRFAGARRS